VFSLRPSGTCDSRYRPWWYARAEQCERAPTRGACAQDLVKSRTRVEAAKLREAQAPLLIRHRLGRLEKARHQRLGLVDCVCVEERVGEMAKNIQFEGGSLPRIPARFAAAPPPPPAAPPLSPTCRDQGTTRILPRKSHALLQSAVPAGSTPPLPVACRDQGGTWRLCRVPRPGPENAASCPGLRCAVSPAERSRANCLCCLLN